MYTDQPQESPTKRERAKAAARVRYAADPKYRARIRVNNKAWRKSRDPAAAATARARYNALCRERWALLSEEQKTAARAKRSARVRESYAAGRRCRKKSYRSIGSEYREALIHAMAERDGWKCWVCAERVSLQTGSVDHVVSPLDGGTHTLGNMKIACKPCNTRRGSEAWVRRRGR